MMLQLDPIARPTLAEIREHEWYNLSVPTHAEIIAEFQQRKNIIDQNRLNENEDIPDEVPDPSVFENFAFRDIVVNEENKKFDDLNRSPETYIPEFKRVTQFFSTSNLESLYNTLVLFAHKTTKECKLSAIDYSADMDIIEEETKIKLTVNILKFEDQDKYCVEVVKNSGKLKILNCDTLSLHFCILPYLNILKINDAIF